MAYEVLSDAKFRVVRDSDGGAYHIQVGFGNHFRTFAGLKLGKLDQLRELARLEAVSQQAAPAEPTE